MQEREQGIVLNISVMTNVWLLLTIAHSQTGAGAHWWALEVYQVGLETIF